MMQSDECANGKIHQALIRLSQYRAEINAELEKRGFSNDELANVKEITQKNSEGKCFTKQPDAALIGEFLVSIENFENLLKTEIPNTYATYISTLIFMIGDYRNILTPDIELTDTLEANIARKRQGKKTKEKVLKEIEKLSKKGLLDGLSKRQIAEKVAEKTGLSASHIRSQFLPSYSPKS